MIKCNRLTCVYNDDHDCIKTDVVMERQLITIPFTNETIDVTCCIVYKERGDNWNPKSY